MIAARPPLLYWNPVTVAVIHAITQLRESGVPVFFTMDAGPQVKAVCSEGEGSFVSERLRKIPGVLEVVQCGIGGGARVIQD